jgi:hypothetical protein
MPIFFSGGPEVTPPNALSTMKAVTLSFVSPVTGSVTGVWAKTVMTSANPPLLIQIFDPFRIKCLPSGDNTARDLRYILRSNNVKIRKKMKCLKKYSIT